MRRVHLYAVGQPYSATRSIWPERVEYSFRAGAHELRMFLRDLSSRDVEDVARGPAEFGLLVEGDVIVFLYRFGTAIPWSDAPYSWHLVQRELPDEATLPEPAEIPEPHDLLHVILVDAGTGVVKALRVVTFSPAFTAAIRLAIRYQAARPWPGDAAYNQQVKALYARYPPSEAMVRAAKIKTLGGR